MTEKSRLLESLKKDTNYTVTDNYALTHSSSLSHCLDFFAQGGAFRQRSPRDKFELFLNAYTEDSILAFKILFYLRDVREGQGERQLLRDILAQVFATGVRKWTEEQLIKFLWLIPLYGRWDDLISLLENPSPNTPVKEIFAIISSQLGADMGNFLDRQPISLLAKWMPSINTSSAKTRRLAYTLVAGLRIPPPSYRKMLAELRAYLNVVEVKMTDNKWDEIKYESLPSKAAIKYRNAFLKHDSQRYTQYRLDVKKGIAKINTKTLYPYEIVREVLNYRHDETIELAWENLPNYLKDDTSNTLVVCDTSGSMLMGSHNTIAPLHVALSLALYTAERNKGIFHNAFITFSANPELQYIQGDSLVSKLLYMKDAEWGGNTNIQAVFDLILSTALNHVIHEDEMPQRIIIISDMQFDTATGSNLATNFEEIERKYRLSGYQMPELIFWNVNAFKSQSPVEMDESGVALVSGCSPTIFQAIAGADTSILNPFTVMMDTINAERYQRVEDAFRE